MTVRVTVLLLLSTTSLMVYGQSWVARYNGQANDEDQAWGIATDDSGCVYVTGTSWGSGTSNDFVTIKYGPGGEPLWSRRLDGATHGGDEARAIAVRGNRVAVTGGSAAANLFTDVLTVVYDLAGDSLWAATYNGTGDGNDHALAVVLDAAGSVHVAGYAHDDSTSWDFVTMKYSPAGTRLWAARCATEFEDFASAIAIDSASNVYVTGSSGNPYLLTWDYTTVKYNPDGVEQWARTYNGPAGEDDEPRAIAVDGSGNVHVTGGSLDSTSGLDFATIKYSPTGETLWIRRYNGPANGPDEANALALDRAGDVLVAGYSQGTTTDIDYATVKYDADGNQLWVQRYDGAASAYDEARAMAVDDSNNVYVTGSSAGSGSRGDYATVKYDASGNERWVQRYDGPASRLDEALAITVQPTRGVCVTGGSAGSGTGTDYATLHYPATGIEETPSGEGSMNGPGATIVRGILYLPACSSAVRYPLFDPSGRTVTSLQAGLNNVRGLGPGVYFLSTGAKLVIAD